MINTQSSTRLVAVAAGVAVALVLMLGASMPVRAAALTSVQIQSILNLLTSFGADSATLNNVSAALNGQPTSGTGGSTGGTVTGGVCPFTWTRSLQQGSTGADVKALQAFLNMSASTMVAASGAGSPGMETMTFGPATKAAVMKFQAANGISAIGIVGPMTMAKLNSLCAGNSNPGTGTGTGTGTPTTGGAVTVTASAQPANALAIAGATRVPFTTFTLSNTSSQPVTINGVTVQRTGPGLDLNFSGVVLLDSNGLQVGTAKTLNSNHQAVIGDGFTLGAGQTMTYMVAGNIATGQSTSGQIVSLQVVGINSTATVSGVLPINGASQTINTSLTIGSVSTSTSSFDPGTTQQRNIGDTAVRFAGIRFTAGSAEDLKLNSVRWRQVGSVGATDLANIMTIVNGTSYSTTVDATGKYYTTVFPGGISITKGSSVDVYIQGDLVGSNSASRTVDFDIDRVTDVYFTGQLYGYGVAPSGTYTPWYNGYAVTVNAGTVTTISKANSGAAGAQNIAVNVQNQPLGGFTTNFAGENVSVTQMVFSIATTSGVTAGLTNISIVDENGVTVAGPADESVSAGTVTFTDTVTFPTGAHTYYLKGKVPTASNGSTVTLSTTPSSQWSNPTGQTTGNTVSLSGASLVTMNTMTVKSGALLVSMSAQPASQTIIAGSSNFTFANVLLNAQQSGESLRLAAIPVNFTGNASNLTGCQMFDGTTALNTGSRVKNSITSGSANTFSLDNTLTVNKGEVKTVAIKCNLSSSATSSSSYLFSADTTTGDYSVTGVDSGSTITPTITSSNGGTMTAGSASGSLAVDSSSAAYTVGAAGTSGVTMGVFKARATNDTLQLTKVGMILTSGAAGDLGTVSVYNGATLVGTATFGSGQTVATSTLNTPITIPADTEVKLTIKADLADVGVGKSGTEGNVIKLDPSSAEFIGTTGTFNTGGTTGVAGVRLYNSFPTFTYSTTGGSGVLTNGTNTLLSLTVAADAANDIKLNKLTFTLATTTVTLTAPTFSGPNGNVASSTNVNLSNVGTTITVFFDSTSNTNDATIGAGDSKTYTLRGTIAGLTGSNSGTVSVALNGDSSQSTIATTPGVSPANIVWSPFASTTVATTSVDWTNSYGLKGCYSTVGLGNNCDVRVLTN